MEKPNNPPASEKTLRDEFAGEALQGLLSARKSLLPEFLKPENLSN